MSEDEAKALARAYLDSGQDIYEFCKGLEPAQVAAIKKLIKDGGKPRAQGHSTAQKRWQSMVDRYAGSMSDMNWREMDESNRFRAFTDKELDELRYAVIARSELYGLYPPLRQLAAGLADEIEAEIRRRREEEAAPTYRGPGCYTDRRNGTTLHVIGRAMIDGEAHLLIGSSLEDPDMWTLPANHIEGRDIKGDRLFNFGEYT